MRSLLIQLFLGCLLVACLFAQNSIQGPTDKKAQKSYQQALEYIQEHEPHLALWYLRDADKQDHGHCLPCQEQMVQVGLSIGDWKAVEDGASGLTSQALEPKQQAVAHYYLGMAQLNEGIDKHQTDLIVKAHNEFLTALSSSPFPDFLFEDGKALAQLHKDEEAKAAFQKFISMTPEGEFKRQRAKQFVNKPELARANLAPYFAITTADGRRFSLGDLEGKVILVYFWASSCDTCARALPHLRTIAKKFEKQPFVILTVDVDYDGAAWGAFLQKNDVPGLQCRDGFNGPIAQVFGVGIRFQGKVDNPIAGVWTSSHSMEQDVPKMFTIDADGVLHAEKLSDSFDARLQDLLNSAAKNQENSKAPADH